MALIFTTTLGKHQRTSYKQHYKKFLDQPIIGSVPIGTAIGVIFEMTLVLSGVFFLAHCLLTWPSSDSCGVI